MSEILNQIMEKLYAGEDATVAELTQSGLDEGLPPEDILKGGLLAGMDKVGVDFRDGELFVPEVLLAANAMHAGMDILRPLLSDGSVASVGKIIFGTVEGDLHDIGKNLVLMMLEGGGFEIIDLGINVNPEQFVNAIKTENPDLVGMSAMLTTTMTAMKNTIECLEESGLRDEVKVIIGGAPVTKEFADEIGADGYAPDAASAVEQARILINELIK
ncbi:MAG: corrinoid protein [Anaerolineales bacterium]|jgi:5-methyltetrahydrofolate--homocysteine methyltransferase